MQSFISHKIKKDANFDLCSALMAIEQWGFFSVSHLLWHGTFGIMVISEDPWHSHLMPSVWQWSYHYFFLRLRSVPNGILTPNLPLAGRTLTLWELTDNTERPSYFIAGHYSIPAEYHQNLRNQLSAFKQEELFLELPFLHTSYAELLFVPHIQCIFNKG